ncbi:phosphopentomutase [Afifella sp. IM 167]|uniref:phosphopentomutase n=1 Tax=Afifella sp. IM 167 TaxID=2033586 RepID=UPI001CCA0DFF|nr:phosphopentomutase [Afifella sp. IM 167]MBZ8135458.1 phosphopentomutase [Afifella sp. IM 167]
MARGFLLVMDSVGVGGAKDAAEFGDEGADTLGHIAAACAAGDADREGLRSGPLDIPNLNRLGLGRAAEASSGAYPAGLAYEADPDAIWGFARERSRGKDTTTGHWELAGCPLRQPWGYFPQEEPAFPAELTEALVAEAKLPGILGNRHASGTAIIAELGEEHVRTGKPICYTSADSVFQIAAHEEAFGLERLYETCKVARKLCDKYRIGRVIARPFLGSGPDDFARTGNRKDFSVPPPARTLLDEAAEIGRDVWAVGKISDIFAGRGVTEVLKAPDNESQFDRTLEAAARAKDGDLVFTNFIDFDQIYGHRRDPAGYAACLEAFDRRLPELFAALKEGDFVILTADHGNDPTWTGTDHTRENVPVLAFGPGIEGRKAGELQTYADIGQTLAAHLALPPLFAGASMI